MAFHRRGGEHAKARIVVLLHYGERAKELRLYVVVVRNSTIDQLGNPGHESSGGCDRLGRQGWRDFGARTGFVVGDCLKTIRKTEESAQFLVDPRIAPDQPMKLGVHPAMGFHRTSGPLGDQRLGGMESSQIGRTSGRIMPAASW